MLRLRDIMTRNVVTVGPETSVREALELFAECHISGAPVVSGDTLLGVVSSTDLMALIALLPGAPGESLEQDPWQEQGEDDDARGTYFTELSDANAGATIRFPDISNPEWNLLDDYTVSDVMTRAPIWQLSPLTPVPFGAQAMRLHGIHRILVTEGSKLVGIVSTTDIANAVAQNRLVTRTYVFPDSRHFNTLN
jgi:CBS domain-containing protein